MDDAVILIIKIHFIYYYLLFIVYYVKDFYPLFIVYS